MKKLLPLLFCVLLFMGCKQQEQSGVILVTPEEMQQLMDLEEVQLIDVRTAQEHQEGFIQSAQNIDFSSPTIDEDIKGLDKSKPVILYCRTGRRSAKCGDKLKAAGFEKIYELKGGITQWQFKDLPVEQLN